MAAPPTATATASPEPTPEPTPTPAPPPTGDGLAVGLTEQNPHLMWAPGEAQSPPRFARRAAGLRALRPRYFRLIVDWSAIQPEAGAPADLARIETGCLRDRQPCAPYAGLRDRLRALAARQREGGWETLVVITWTPAWAAAPGRGCERDDTDPRARPPRRDALPAYRALVAQLLALAEAEGAQLRYWSPWNEPNHPGFISPQRPSCAAGAPTAAAGPYAAIARALRRALREAPGDQRLVLGETAGLLTTKPTHTPVGEFVDALPRRLVCAADVWTTHGYVLGEDPVDALDAALRRHGCRRPLWITETGIQGDLPGACRDLARRLRAWHEDPRVGAAFNYTWRTDDRFPTGVVSTDLRERHPTYRAWRAWAAGEPAGDPC